MTGSLRSRAVGPEIPDRGGVLAPRVVERDSVLRVPAGGAAGDLHHELDRERECAAAQDHQDARPFPVRRRRQQTDLAGAAQHHRQMEQCRTRLEGGHESIRHPLPGPLHAAANVRCSTTDFPTASVVRRKRRPPPWKSLATASHTEIRTLPTKVAQPLRPHDFSKFCSRKYDSLGVKSRRRRPPKGQPEPSWSANSHHEIAVTAGFAYAIV